MAGRAASTCGCAPNAADTDLEVTLTEVRPDGQEGYIQSGWLRALPPRARRGRVDRRCPRSTPTSRPTPRRCPPASSCRCGSGCSRSPTCSAPARGCGSTSRRPAATSRSGSSTPSPRTAFVNDIGHSVGRPSKVVLPVLPAAAAPDVPATAAGVSRAAQPAVPRLPAGSGGDRCAARPDGDDRFDVRWTAPTWWTAGSLLVTTGPAPDPESAPLSVEPAGAADRGRAPRRPPKSPVTVTSFTFAAQPDVAYTATVQAVYADGPAPVSNASLEATLVVADTPLEHHVDHCGRR